MRDAALRVFGRRGDPGRIALVIARALTGSEVEREGERYRVNVGARKGLFRQISPPYLVVEIDAASFEGETADAARSSVWHDVERSIRGPGLDEVLGMIPDLHISVTFVPAGDEQLRPSDPLAQVALDVASRTDGFVLDLHNGRLLSVTGEELGSTGQFVADGGTPLDPSAGRVQGRLVGLVAVAARALTEYDGQDLEEARDGIARWVRLVGLGAELETHERAILQRPAGALDDAELAYGTWQIEGAAVLAWALELLDDLPAYDEAVDPTLLSAVLCFPDATNTRLVLERSSRRFQAGVDAQAARHLDLYRQLWEVADSGPGGADEVDLALSITTERLRACNWLRAGGIYSDTRLGA